MSVAIDYSSGAFAANKAQGVGTIAQAQAGYGIANASYDSVSFAFGSQDNGPLAIFFKSDGTKMYMLGFNGDRVYQYSLSTAWDLSTISYDSVSFSIGSQDGVGVGLAFKSDGTKMYMLGNSSGTVYQYSLSTGWDISTASYDSVSFSVATQEAAPRGMTFKDDGTIMYIVGDTENVHTYNLSTAWDLSTASYANQLFSVASQDTSLADVRFNNDGTKMFILGSANDNVFQYSLSTAWNVSTASYDSVSFSISSQDTSPYTIFFKSDGTKMYLLGTVNDTVYQYSTGSYVQNLDISSGTYFNYTPTANTTFTFGNAPASGTAAGFALAVTGANVGETYDIANASYDSVSFSVASQDGVPVGITFKPDGTSMFIIGNGNDNVYQYTLSTAWDASTASYASKSFSVATQETAVSGSAFKPDGTLLYVCGSGTDSVFQYTLSTAWDISTASYASKSFSFSTQDNVVTGVAFNDDGTKMYISGSGNDTIFQYSLSTAWDVSTASYTSKSFSVSSIEGSPRQLNCSPTGNKLWFTGLDTGYVYELDLSTNFDISTASYNSVNFSTATQASSPTATFFKTDGTKMYVVSIATDTIYQYSTGSSATATFSYPASVEWPSGTAPDGPASGETDVLVFLTDDGGTSYQGFQAGDAMA